MKKRLFLAALIVLFGFVVYFPGSTWKDLFIMPFYSDVKSIPLTVLPGQTVRSVAESMVSLGIAVDRENLVRFMVRKGLDRKLQPGVYHLNPGPSWRVVDCMLEAKPDRFVITIIPGTILTEYYPSRDVSEDIVSLLAEDDLWPSDILSLLPDEHRYRSAFLLPETYYLAGPSPKSLVTQASKEWLKHLGDGVKSSADAFEKAIVASLVEMESFKDEERSRVAGVIYNRLKKEMPLQIDATVVYAWKLKGRDLKRVMFDDLKVDSPYNTYRIKGLPPGPICIPSLESWKATLSPEEHSYLYYVADGTGGHVFTENYEDHLKAIKSIRGK